MELDKILNFKKVRCVKGYDDCLEIGKEYNVIDIDVDIKVKDDRGDLLYWRSDYFEPVLDSAENPLQGAELTLVEKLRNKRKEWASNPHYWMDSYLISDVFNDVIDIVKQHQAESEVQDD